MKKFCSLVLMFLLIGTLCAQVSLAPFSSSTGTYTEITGGTVLGNATSDDQRFVNPAVPLGGTTSAGPGFPIGFNFSFDNVVYDRFAVNNNGWVCLGQSVYGNNAVFCPTSSTPISAVTAISPAQLVSRVAGLANDLVGQTGSELRILTVGVSPNRECVIQWKGYRKYLAGGSVGDNYNFQIRLVETTNEVKVVYGVMTNNATLRTVQVGLRGAPANPASNFANRTTTTDWANTTTGGVASATCDLSNTVYPASGLTYTWGPIPACSGTPAPGNTVTSAIAVCPAVSFNLTLQNYTPGSGVTYQWQSSPTGSDPWTNFGISYFLISNTQTSANYYRCQVTCSGNTTTSNPVFVNMYSSTFCSFCSPTYTNHNAFDGMSQVTLFPLSQATGLNVNPSYYNYVYTQNAIPNLTRGGVANISIAFQADPVQYHGIWVDFNQSGVFETSEFFTLGTVSEGLNTIIVPISVPVGATLGITRLRIRGADNSQPSSSQACGASNSTRGQGQDFAVKIVDPVSLIGHVSDYNGIPLAGATIECLARGSVTSGADGSYSFSIPSGLMQLKCSKPGYNDVVITTDIPAGSTTTQDFTLNNPEMEINPGSIFKVLRSDDNTTENLQMTNKGNGTLGWNATVNYNSNREAQAEYCSASIYSCQSGAMYISRVVLNTIDNSSACLSYSNFTALSANLIPGNTYTIHVTEGGVPTASDKVSAWIDWNQDGQFGEAPIIFTGNPLVQMNGTFTVPQDVMTGSTRLRIRLTYGPTPTPCGLAQTGEVEDYTVNVLSWLTLNNNYGSVPAGGESTIPVSINAAIAEDGSTGIPGQTYISELIFHSRPDVGTITIPVTLAVTDPDLKSPQELALVIINEQEGKFMLKWEYFSIKSTLFDHFVIMRNGEIHGTSGKITFDEIITEPGTYCYKVYAVYTNGAYSEPSNEVCLDYPFPPDIPLSDWALVLGGLLIGAYAFIMIRKKL